jgi:hypothetical protein
VEGGRRQTIFERLPLGRPRKVTECRMTSPGFAATSSPSWTTSVGTVCIYQASSPEAIRAHAQAADLPVDEIIAVADTVVVRPDPVAVAA